MMSSSQRLVVCAGLGAQKETGAIRFCLLLSECNAMWNADNNILRLTCVLATYFAMYNCYVHEKMVFQTIALTSCHMINWLTINCRHSL